MDKYQIPVRLNFNVDVDLGNIQQIAEKKAIDALNESGFIENAESLAKQTALRMIQAYSTDKIVKMVEERIAKAIDEIVAVESAKFIDKSVLRKKVREQLNSLVKGE